ncbi:hypothetical protein [Cryobacterium melibiosiphilum]|uniref:hypothetical protein n=1 Tax=Cryobacterium melibiosiphilum TaxID=995039 RepID=UPI0011C21E3F|nr:hypothetical protein [Cryobacterium melibiosiphilum]
MKRMPITLALAAAAMVALSGCQANQPIEPDSSASASPDPVESSASSDPVQTDEPSSREFAQAWADETFGAFKAFTASGNGAGDVLLPDDAKSGFYTISWGPNHWDNERSGAQIIGEDGTRQSQGWADFPGDSASVAYGVDPLSDPAASIRVGPGAGDWSITVSPISELPALPETGGFNAYLYAGAEQPVVFSTTNSGRVGVQQFNGVDSSDSILHQDAAGTLLAGPSVVNVQLVSVSPWTRSKE